MKKLGYKWIAVPHGMLEPWSLEQKWLKKQLYFRLLEYPMLKRADAVVAVGRPEYDNLRKLFKNVHHIPNGITPFSGSAVQKSNGSADQQINRHQDFLPRPPVHSSTRLPVHNEPERLTFLFLGRLHHKKGVVPLVRAWLSSSLNNDSRFRLIVAGPDDGEGPALATLLDDGRWKMEDGNWKVEDGRRKIEDGSSALHPDSSVLKTIVGEEKNFTERDHPSSIPHPPSSNILLAGSVYGREKEKLLLSATYFLLPSQSEGFPTSILEAMTHGCIPVFSEGCNFPEAVEADVGVSVGLSVGEIRARLEELKEWTEEKRKSMAEAAKEFADKNYNWRDIAGRQVRLYEELVKE